MEGKVYINVLLDSLNKKILILDQLNVITSKQEVIIQSEDKDVDALEQTFTEKEDLLTQLNQLDEGFDKVYQHVKAELNDNKWQYKEEVIKLQELIRLITDKSTKLQAMELRNKNQIQRFYANRKKEIKDLKISSRTAENYYRNVMSQQAETNYFFDKKK